MADDATRPMTFVLQPIGGDGGAGPKGLAMTIDGNALTLTLLDAKSGETVSLNVPLEQVSENGASPGIEALAYCFLQRGHGDATLLRHISSAQKLIALANDESMPETLRGMSREMLIEIALHGRNAEERRIAFEAVPPEALERIIRQTEDDGIRRMALERLGDSELLKKLAKDPRLETATDALRRIEKPEDFVSVLDDLATERLRDILRTGESWNEGQLETICMRLVSEWSETETRRAVEAMLPKLGTDFLAELAKRTVNQELALSLLIELRIRKAEQAEDLLEQIVAGRYDLSHHADGWDDYGRRRNWVVRAHLMLLCPRSLISERARSDRTSSVQNIAVNTLQGQQELVDLRRELWRKFRNQEPD